MIKTQKEQVLKHLEKKKSITSWDAINLYGITRLAAVIHDLRSEGKLIHSTTERGNGKKWARYVLMRIK